MITEIWRTPIDKGEKYDKYQVSNLGRMINLNYRNTGKAKLMELSECTDGYLKVGLSKNGKTDIIRVHRIVAQTFLPNPDNLPEVNHKIEGDEGKKINMVIFNEDGSINKEKTTIEWCDRDYNNNYGTRNERISKANTNGKLSKKVLQFSKTGEFIREWESTMECERKGYNHTNIVKCCNGKLKSAYGFKWQYA